jgi:hypothetical protein
VSSDATSGRPGEEDMVTRRLATFFDGRGLEAKSSRAAYVITVGVDGRPHSAMISVGEMVIAADGPVRLGLWANSRTTANIVRTGTATILMVLNARSVRAHLELRQVIADDTLAYFTGSVAEATEDVAPYATLVSGVSFELHDRAAALSRWAQTVERLRAF